MTTTSLADTVANLDGYRAGSAVQCEIAGHVPGAGARLPNGSGLKNDLVIAFGIQNVRPEHRLLDLLSVFVRSLRILHSQGRSLNAQLDPMGRSIRGARGNWRRDQMLVSEGGESPRFSDVYA